MSTNSDLIAALGTATAAIAAKINLKAETAFKADNALKLGNKSAADLVADANATVAPHAQNLANPHKTTAAQAGAFTKEEITNMLAQRLPSGLLPLARWAGANGEDDVAPQFSFSNAPLSVTFAAMTVLLNGSQYKVPLSVVNLTPNAVNYIYFKLVVGVPKHVASTAQLAESNTQMFVGSVTTTGVVVSNTIAPVIRLGLYRLSTTRRGASIPVSGGSPVSPQPLLWT